jgi:23S rRNA (adenine2030-N6)-methyltransferase
MNYRHIFHAGNFADVLKHFVLARCLEYLKEKTAPFRVIDTHSGVGIYDLDGVSARKTGEWREGIGRIIGASIPDRERRLLAPYLEAIEALSAHHKRHMYPGSPEISRYLTRAEDRMIFVEKHPQDAKMLADNFSFDGRAKIVELDGYVAVKAFLPPKERRGLVLIDPPYEERDEFERVLTAFKEAYRKWPTGIYLLWYPIKNPNEVKQFLIGLSEAGIQKIMRAELLVKRADIADGLAGSGMIVVNPPWKLESELRTILPWLDGVMRQDDGHRWSLDWLAGEKPALDV